MSGPSNTDRKSGRVELLDEPAQYARMEADVLGALDAVGYPQASKFAIRLALEEACLNALRHGHRNLPGVPVLVTWDVEPDSVRIEVEDRGPGFDPADVPDPTAPERLEIPAGRGLLLMRAYMTSVEFNEKGNRVTMLHRRTPGAR